MSSSGGATTVCAVPVGESRAAAGARRSLAPVEALTLALLADIGFAHIETEGGLQAIDGLTVDSWRMRVGAESSHG